MFGYITPFKAELKVREYNEFKAYYCGLCFSIKKQFGNIPRMLLNYDMTFLALFLDGLTEEQYNVNKKRCVSHLSNKKPVVTNNKAIDYAANMNVALAYYKFLDDVADDKTISSKFKSMFLSTYKKKFNPSILEINKIVEENLITLYNLEKNKQFNSIDEICDPFSVIVGKILELYPQKIFNDSAAKRDILYSFGYTLGKWIYLVDALDDLEKDIKNNKFNPINCIFNKDNLNYQELLEITKDKIEFSILNCASNCRTLLEQLEIKKHQGILTNIISLGMMDKYNRIINKGSVNNESI